ncbi:MAG: hypothetical protein AAFX07_00600 [Pseudomonadota bacterium]
MATKEIEIDKERLQRLCTLIGEQVDGAHPEDLLSELVRKRGAKFSVSKARMKLAMQGVSVEQATSAAKKGDLTQAEQLQALRIWCNAARRAMK